MRLTLSRLRCPCALSLRAGRFVWLVRLPSVADAVGTRLLPCPPILVLLVGLGIELPTSEIRADGRINEVLRGVGVTRSLFSPPKLSSLASSRMLSSPTPESSIAPSRPCKDRADFGRTRSVEALGANCKPLPRPRRLEVEARLPGRECEAMKLCRDMEVRESGREGGAAISPRIDEAKDVPVGVGGGMSRE